MGFKQTRASLIARGNKWPWTKTRVWTVWNNPGKEHAFPINSVQLVASSSIRDIKGHKIPLRQGKGEEKGKDLESRKFAVFGPPSISHNMAAPHRRRVRKVLIQSSDHLEAEWLAWHYDDGSRNLAQDVLVQV